MTDAFAHGLAIAFGAMVGFLMAYRPTSWSVYYWRGQAEHWQWMADTQKRRAECAEAELRMRGKGNPYR